MAEVFEAPNPDAPPAPKSSGLKGGLSKMVGPLPVWGWAAVLTVAAVVVVKRRRTTTAATPDQVTYAQQAQQPTVGATAGMVAASPTVTKPGGGATTNDGWRSQAVAVLASKGYSSLAADTAVGKYLSGLQLSTTERGLVDIALASLGTPPSPPPAGGDTPTTSTGLPSWITGANASRDTSGRITGIDQTYSAKDTPADFATGVTGAHFAVDPTTGAITSGHWWRGSERIELPEHVIAAYQSQGAEKLAGV